MVESVVEAMEEALHELSPREEQVVRLRFGLGHRARDVAAIAVRFRLTQAGVLRIEEQALQKLRASALDIGAARFGVGRQRDGRALVGMRRARLPERTNDLVKGHARRRSTVG